MVVSVLVVKIALSFFAFITSVISIADLKSFREERPDQDQSAFWLRRLSFWGKVKVACATVTLGLVAVNEYWSYADGAESKAREAESQKKLSNAMDAAGRSVDEGRTALGAAILNIRALANQNEYLVRSLDGLQTRYGTARIHSDAYEDIYTKVSVEGLGVYTPRPGDTIDWQFVCHVGTFPRPIERAGSCARRPYGHLLANGEVIQLTSQTGRVTYLGTRSTGGEMKYVSPSELEACLPMAIQLKSNDCELRIEIAREARWKFIHQSTRENPQSPEQLLADTCRKYEALYGKSCRDILQ